MSEMINKTITGIAECLSEFDNDDKIELVTWVNDEYQHFMISSKEQYIKTLDGAISSNIEAGGLFQFLRDNIEAYGSTKAFYFASQEMLAKLENKDLINETN